MIETRTYCFDDGRLPLVHEAIGGAHSHSELLAHFAARRAELLAELEHHGALLFRGFAVEGPRAFLDVVQIFAPTLLDYAGGDSPREAITDKVYTSTSYPAALPIPLHNEMSYSRAYPSLIAFYCQVAPAEDGETPLADCRRVLGSLAPEVVERFSRKRIRYIQTLRAAKGLGKSWPDTFETSDRAQVERILRERRAEFEWRSDGSLRVAEVIDPIVAHPRSGETVFFCQAHLWHVSSLDAKTRDALLKITREEDLYHRCTFGDGSPIGDGDLREVRRAMDAAATKFPWRKHDVLLVDNILVAHGRSPFRGARRVLVAMGHTC